jgi:hypothetical protein
MTADRPTTKQLASASKNWKAARKPKFIKTGAGSYVWNDVVIVCNLAQLPLHPDAETYWNKQTVPPSKRKVILACGKKTHTYLTF